MPIEIIADWSKQKDRSKVLELLERRGLAYWKDPFGRPAEVVDLCELMDDPNLMLARNIVLRATVERLMGELVVHDVTGAVMAAVIKINRDPPHLENRLANALWRAGIRFDDERPKSDLSAAEVERYLKIFRADHDEELSEVLLLDEPLDVAQQKDIRKTVRKILEDKHCALNLLP